MNKTKEVFSCKEAKSPQTALKEGLQAIKGIVVSRIPNSNHDDLFKSINDFCETIDTETIDAQTIKATISFLKDAPFYPKNNQEITPAKIVSNTTDPKDIFDWLRNSQRKDLLEKVEEFSKRIRKFNGSISTYNRTLLTAKIDSHAGVSLNFSNRFTNLLGELLPLFDAFSDTTPISNNFPIVDGGKPDINGRSNFVEIPRPLHTTHKS